MSDGTSGISDGFGAFEGYFLSFMVVAAISLIALKVLFFNSKSDPVPDNVPYEIPLSRDHKKDSSIRIQLSLLAVMNVFWLIAAILLLGKLEIPQFRSSIEFNPMIMAVAAWEVILGLYAYASKCYSASLTIDERGVQWQRGGNSKAYFWKDISDVRIVYGNSLQRRAARLQIRLRGEPADFDNGTDIRYPGLNIYRLQETIRKGMRIWGNGT